jgi:hypothetical protein
MEGITVAMTIFRYWPNTRDYESLTADLNELTRLARLMGQRVGPGWTAPALRTMGRGEPFSDFPHLWPTLPVFSERALTILSPLLADQIEPLSFDVQKKRFYLINVLDVIDCLDVDQSILSRNFVTGHISSILRYAFFPERVADHHMFKIPQTSDLEILVSSAFRETVQSNGLTSLDFIILP